MSKYYKPLTGGLMLRTGSLAIFLGENDDKQRTLQNTLTI